MKALRHLRWATIVYSRRLTLCCRDLLRTRTNGLRIQPSLIIFACLLSTTGSVRAASWTISSDFDTEHDPSEINGGVWSYGTAPTVGGTMSLYTQNGLYSVGLAYWFTPGYDTIEYNTTGQPITILWQTWSPHSVSMHIGSSGSTPVIRFTAPMPGTYTVSGSFGPGDIYANMTVYVLRSGTQAFAGSYVNAASVPFSLSFGNVSAGETIDLEASGNYVSGDAGVDATISYTEVGPAPFTLADLLKALEIAVGTSPATSDDITRLNVEAVNAGLDISDAARLARKVVGLEANP